MIDTDKYTGHTDADQWTTYKMGADNPHHAVRFGEQGLNLELKFGADARLIADAPLLLAEVKRLQERLDWILGDEELASYVWEKEVAYMEWEGVRLPWISADEWGEEE